MAHSLRSKTRAPRLHPKAKKARSREHRLETGQHFSSLLPALPADGRRKVEFFDCARGPSAADAFPNTPHSRWMYGSCTTVRIPLGSGVSCLLESVADRRVLYLSREEARGFIRARHNDLHLEPSKVERRVRCRHPKGNADRRRNPRQRKPQHDNAIDAMPYAVHSTSDAATLHCDGQAERGIEQPSQNSLPNMLIGSRAAITLQQGCRMMLRVLSAPIKSPPSTVQGETPTHPTTPSPRTSGRTIPPIDPGRGCRIKALAASETC